MTTYKRIVLAQRPETDIDDKTFKMETAPLPDKSSLKADQVLVKVEHLSLDPGELIEVLQPACSRRLTISCLNLQPPAMRGWLRDTRSYLPPVKIGEVMRAGGLGSVVAVGSGVKSVKVGDKVEGTLGQLRSTGLPCQSLIPMTQAGKNTPSLQKTHSQKEYLLKVHS